MADYSPQSGEFAVVRLRRGPTTGKRVVFLSVLILRIRIASEGREAK